MNNNQIMIFTLIKKREEIKWRYYYQKNKLKLFDRKQELETITNVYLTNVDWIAERLEYYRGKEKNERN